MSICVLAERYGVKGQTLRKQYKEKISDYRNWDQLEHAHDYLLYPENIGENLSLDETCLSNGDVYTILTNKAAKGRKGALVAMVRGVATDGLSGNLWLVSFKISYLCLPLFYETRTTPSCHPSGCAYRQL